MAKTPYTAVSIAIKQVGTQPNAIAKTSYIGHRTVISPATQLSRLVPAPNYPTLDLYKTFEMPTLANGDEAMSYMKNLGFTVNYGIQFSLSLPAPTAVILGATGTNLVTLQYNYKPQGFSQLLNISMAGTVTQGANTGTLKSASITGTTSFLYNIVINTTDVYTTGAVLSITAINYSISRPDPARTEEICMMMYYAYSEIPNLDSTQQPTFYLNVLSPDDVYGPSALPIDLAVEPSTVIVNGDGTVTLIFNTAPANFGRLPITALGASTVTQSTSLATGTIVSTGDGPTQNSVEILVTDVTGTFSTTTTENISIVLDSTQTVFEFLNTVSLSGIVSPYEITTVNDIKYTQFLSAINTFNNQFQGENGKFYVAGYMGITSIARQQLSNLPKFNSQYIHNVYFPFSKKLGDITQTAAMITAAYSVPLANNPIPFNPVNNYAFSSILPSVDKTQYLTKGVTGDVEAVLQLGSIPIAVNAEGKAYIVRAVTSLLDVPGTTIPDDELYPITTWQSISYVRLSIYTACTAILQSNVKKTPAVRARLRGQVIATLRTLESLGIIQNVTDFLPFILVSDNPTDATALDISVPAQIIPELSSITANVGIYSSLLSVSLSLGAA